MKQKLILLAAVLGAFLAVFVYQRSEDGVDRAAADPGPLKNTAQRSAETTKENSVAKKQTAQPEPSSTSSSYKKEDGGDIAPQGRSAKGAGSPEAWKTAPSLSKKELASVRKFMDFAFQFARPQQQPKALLKLLEQERLAPIAVQDFNDDTGKMLIVRTKETLEGTRFFHAQFFEDEKKRTYLQHLSFEIRPSPDCMNQAVAMIEKRLGTKVEPLQAPTDQYALYKAPGDYIVWAKRLEMEDLDSDPFIPRDPENDVGTCRVAVEKDIHAHENH